MGKVGRSQRGSEDVGWQGWVAAASDVTASHKGGLACGGDGSDFDWQNFAHTATLSLGRHAKLRGEIDFICHIAVAERAAHSVARTAKPSGNTSSPALVLRGSSYSRTKEERPLTHSTSRASMQSRVASCLLFASILALPVNLPETATTSPGGNRAGSVEPRAATGMRLCEAKWCGRGEDSDPVIRAIGEPCGVRCEGGVMARR